jgi:hypothetical protein
MMCWSLTYEGIKKSYTYGGSNVSGDDFWRATGYIDPYHIQASLHVCSDQNRFISC